MLKEPLPDNTYKELPSDNFESRLRPLISLKQGVVVHNDKKVTVILSRNKIMIGCTDVTVDALLFIIAKYEEQFGKCLNEYIKIQEGI